MPSKESVNTFIALVQIAVTIAATAKLGKELRATRRAPLSPDARQMLREALATGIAIGQALPPNDEE